MAENVARRLLWFVALWAAGVLTVGAIGLVIKLVLS
jgi:preprotein translocase subunit Sss1